MINKLIDAAPGNEIPKLLEEADNLFKSQKFQEAQQIFETLVGMDPGNPKVIYGLLRCLVQLKKYDDANEMMGSLDDETLKNEEIAKIYKLLSNIDDDGEGELEELKSVVSSEPNNKEKRFELPQAFFMRVAMGLAINETDREAKAIEFYNLISSFDFMCSTPTLFNSGTLRPQLSSCYLSTIPDDLKGIFQGISDDAMLSKFAGGLGNDWSQVRALGSYILSLIHI